MKGGRALVVITRVEKGSRAYRAGLEAGDKLLTINGNEINDVLDYRFYLADEKLRMFLGDFIHNGKYHTARAAPIGIEI